MMRLTHVEDPFLSKVNERVNTNHPSEGELDGQEPRQGVDEPNEGGELNKSEREFALRVTYQLEGNDGDVDER